jgi:hypothetical protein
MPVCVACAKEEMKADSTPTSQKDKSGVKNLQIICSDIKGPFHSLLHSLYLH